MDDFGGGKTPVNEGFDRPIPFDDDADKPIPFDDDIGGTEVSHSPLDLGGGPAEVPKIKHSGKMSGPGENKAGEKLSSADRISRVRTFFTKLHPGAVEFLDEQITGWLKANPGIVVKSTNTATGDVQGKKTEPNIIVTIWY